MFENLDKTKTYVGLQVGTSLISKKIQKYSKVYCLDADFCPSHVIALVHKNNKWFIYESTHTAKPELGLNSGARHYDCEKFLKIEDNKLDQYHFYQIDLDINVLDELLGEKYAMASIKDLMLSAIFKNNGKQVDRVGVICSEYVAMSYPPISKYFDLPNWCITPAHWKRFVDGNNISEVKHG